MIKFRQLMELIDICRAFGQDAPSRCSAAMDAWLLDGSLAPADVPALQAVADSLLGLAGCCTEFPLHS